MSKKSITLKKTNTAGFKTQLATYKAVIDKELSTITQRLLSETAEQFGEVPKEVVQAYVNVLTHGGKRIRGSLAMVAYAMFGGTNHKAIVQAACALEMLNTYILIADDIQDRSETRRGGKTAHAQLRDYHVSHHMKGEALHFGEAMAINSFLIAQHYAANIIATLPVRADISLRALQNINRCFMVTAYGQTMDLFVEANGSASVEDVNNILEWKTAYYTFVNPLQLGAILAGASDEDIQTLAEYGLHAGRTFQLTDDVIGTFGKQSITGKSPLDDIKEGKRTLLVVTALAKASPSDAYFLESCLGNQQLTMHEFERCQKIIVDTKALALAEAEAASSAKHAIVAIDKQTSADEVAKHFLIDLAKYLLVRDS